VIGRTLPKGPPSRKMGHRFGCPEPGEKRTPRFRNLSRKIRLTWCAWLQGTGEGGFDRDAPPANRDPTFKLKTLKSHQLFLVKEGSPSV